MITVKIEGLNAAMAALSGQARQVRYAAAVALTRTAWKVADAMPEVMERQLDRPTPFTRKGFRVGKATPQSLSALVAIKDVQARYLRWQIEGGTRQPGPRGIKLPGNIELNAFGNIPKGAIDKLKAAAQSGQLSGALRKRLGVGGRRKGQAPLQLFFGKPQGRGWEKAPVGIYRRVPGTPGKLVPVIVFEDTPARYRPRFKFREAAEAVVQREWQRQFEAAFADAMRTAR